MLTRACAAAIAGSLAAAVWLGSLGGCSSTTSADPTTTPEAGEAGPTCDAAATPATGDLPDAVRAVLVDKCQSCHTSPPKNHAPWPILSFEETQLPYGITDQKRWQRMAAVIEPGGSPHMPLQGSPPLTPDQLATLRAWFATCAMPIPQGTGHDVLDDGGPQL